MAAQSEVKEESITDSYLYRLSRAAPTIRYLSFSRWEEARRTGADWEWWLLLRHGALRFRVQAKKLRGGRNTRAEIVRQNKHGGQMSMLIAAARRDRAIPIYVFFSSPCIYPLLCGATAGGQGAFVATAIAVKALVTGKSVVRDSDVLLRSRPVACIACCLLAGSAQDVRSQVARWLGEFAPNQDENPRSAEGWHEVPPSYVDEILQSSNEADSAIPSHYEGLPPDVQAVLVVDLKQSDSAQ